MNNFDKLRFDLYNHLIRQQAFSHATFGPGRRARAVIDHIRKELKEIEKSLEEEDDTSTMLEWVDVIILAFDGLTRHLAFPYGDEYKDRFSPNDVADSAITLMVEKQTTNEARSWPDWRNSDPDKAIEHFKNE